MSSLRAFFDEKALSPCTGRRRKELWSVGEASYEVYDDVPFDTWLAGADWCLSPARKRWRGAYSSMIELRVVVPATRV